MTRKKENEKEIVQHICARKTHTNHFILSRENLGNSRVGVFSKWDTSQEKKKILSFPLKNVYMC